MVSVRPPAVAGLFYPGDPRELQMAVSGYLGEGKPGKHKPKAIIAPHAGYRFSGPVAGHAFRFIEPWRNNGFSKILLIGPSHHLAFDGVAADSHARWRTPLGSMNTDHTQIQIWKDSTVLDQAHNREHCLEVEVPFLQYLNDSLEIIPLVTGQVKESVIEHILTLCWDEPETLIVVSTDLSHYLDYESARKIDRLTCTAIEQCDAESIQDMQACGHTALRSLLRVAARKKAGVETLDLRNSGDTAGPKDQVVGYGAWAVI